MLPKMVSMVKASETSVVSEWTQLQNAITNADDGSTIRVSGYDTDKDKTITASSTENSLQIHKSIILDLDGCTIYRGRPNPTENNNCVIYVDTSAILTLIDTVGGGTITGGINSGISVNGGSSLIMKGGSIAGNRGMTGGGVDINDSSRFTLINGSITHNSADSSGGGVCIGGGCTFTMSGGSITNNTSYGSGGGIHAEPSSDCFEMTGGEITGNKAANGGGGVTIFFSSGASDKFKISGGPVVRDNKKTDGTADNVSITTSINPVRITGALTGRSVYINQGAGERVAVAEGNYVITESDASRLFSTTDEPMGKVIVNSDQGRFVYFKKKIKDGTISVTPEKPVYDGKTMTPAVTVKMGDTVLDKETFKLSASFKADGPVDIHRKICYSSSNPDIATVDKNGLIKAKRKGKCSVYAYAQNGVYKEVKVTVG